MDLQTVGDISLSPPCENTPKGEGFDIYIYGGVYMADAKNFKNRIVSENVVIQYAFYKCKLIANTSAVSWTE